MKQSLVLTALACAVGSLLAPGQAHAQNIVQNAPTGNLTNSSDITWYYQSQVGPGGTWYTVFRAKGTANMTTSTNASGLDTPFTGFTGIVGAQLPANPGDTGDYVFTSLTLNITTTTTAMVGSTTFFLTAASGSPLLGPGSVPDMGFRTRLREDEVALGIGTNTAADQFASFNLTIDLSASTFNGLGLDQPGSPHVSILHWDSGNNPVPMLNTATSNLTANFANYAHVHRNWGFSQLGNYTLVFTIQGVGGTYGANATTGTSTINFNVIPEPSTGALLLGGLALAALLRRRLSQKC